MKTDLPNQGILNEHATCHTAASRANVRERAVELAAMNGRSALDTSKSDWEQAKRELAGTGCEEHPQTPASTINNHAPMKATVAALLAPGKGILAADESFPTIEKRFTALGIPANEDNRRAYRELLFTTPGLNEFISGAILFTETLHQSTSSGAFMPEALAQQAIIPGIKVDGGTEELSGFPGEKITHGLDGLSDRLAAYRERGARFTKWRAVITIGDGLPTTACIEANAQALALFASQSQEAGLVPIVEPEVLMSGNHTLARCEEVMDATLQAVFAALFEQRVVLETMLLKTGLVLPGQDCPQQATASEIAEATLRCLGRHVPAAVPGIVFLSGGQSDVAATERLNALCKLRAAPWTLSFSFGRALQDQAMKTWKGDPANVAASQAALHHRARCNSLALLGNYAGEDAGLSAPAPHQLTEGEAVAVWQNEGDPN